MLIPIVIEASAMLKTGLKKTKDSFPQKGTQSGKWVFMIGK